MSSARHNNSLSRKGNEIAPLPTNQRLGKGNTDRLQWSIMRWRLKGGGPLSIQFLDAPTYKYGDRTLASISNVLQKIICEPMRDQSPPARFNFLILACLFVPNFVAAQSPPNIETLNVLDANSVAVATLIVPRSSIQASEIAVLINDNDPQSVE